MLFITEWRLRPAHRPHQTTTNVTHGVQGGRTHIWSYAAGWREDSSREFNCPCAANPSTELLTPDYVGHHYYCDTATYHQPKVEWYTNNALWDGKDCYPGSKCCDNERLPWFWRALPQETTDDVEVRWCTKSVGADVMQSPRPMTHQYILVY